MGLNEDSNILTMLFTTPRYTVGTTVLGAELNTTPQNADTKTKDTSILLHYQTHKAEIS